MAKKKKPVTLEKEELPYHIYLYKEDERIYLSEAREEESFKKVFLFLKSYEDKDFSCEIKRYYDIFKGLYTNELVGQIWHHVTINFEEIKKGLLRND